MEDPMPRTITATEAKNRLGAYLRAVADDDEEIVIENHGRPQAVLVPYESYRTILDERDRNRRLEAVARLEALAARVRTRNDDLTEEQADELAQEIRDLALTQMMERDSIRVVDEPGG
jgi:prevent-host-death family protein